MESATIAAVRSGDRRALARAITEIENGGETGSDMSSSSHLIGITGPPGAGKSTLVSALITSMRRRGETVAVLAVDPSSPVTGGALLGDRIRMQSHVDDEGVYIRSMATRGHRGGLSAATGAVAGLMCEAGFDQVIVETVGVGQSEVEIMGLASVVVLVVGPGWGDQVQADKAGIVEIADVFVVNKGDRPGAAEVERVLRETAEARAARVLVTTATTGAGVEDLLAEIDRLLG
jgi:LAO/AO transport system kinase